MKKETNTAPKQERVETKKVEESSPKIKSKEDGYIHHILVRGQNPVDSVLGDDPTPLFHEIDRIYYEHCKKIYNGKICKGTPFDYHIVRTTSNRPFDAVLVQYTPGSLSRNRFRRFEYQDEEDEMDYDSYVNGDY